MNASSRPAANGPMLWQQLQATRQVVQQVRQGRSLTVALNAVPADLRAGVQALSFQTMRQLGRAQAVAQRLAPRKPKPPVANLLITSLALLVDESRPYAEHVLVDQAVTAARKDATTREQAGFVNACLRRFLRERTALLADLDEEAIWNYPRWWISRVKRDHPAHWQSILQASQTPAPLVLRVNRLKVSRNEYLQQLLDGGIPAFAVGEAGIQLQHSRPVTQLPGYQDGWFSVQDAAAQLAAPLLLQGLNRDAPLRLLDACAAPGGKTSHLLEQAPNAQVTALEIDAARSARIGENLARLGLQARVQCADAAQVDAWWDGQPFDGILLDAPCSASGIVRRHPDVRWLRRESDISQLEGIQQQLLQVLWPLLKPGGFLVYVTCSVFRAEGSQQMQVFLQHHADARVCDAPGHLLPLAATQTGSAGENSAGEHDGFFYALLQKQMG